MSDNPLDKMSIVIERLNEVAESLGLKVETAAFIPGPEGGPHYMQAMLRIDPEVTFKTVEEREQAAADKKEFDAMARTLRVDQDREKVEGIQTGAEALVKGIMDLSPTAAGAGLGLDNPTPDPEPEPEEPVTAETEKCPKCEAEISPATPGLCDACGWHN